MSILPPCLMFLQDTSQLQESPYLMHPVEARTTGLYKTPVVVLDFASLYPSLYRAYNLCYSTLLHKDDASSLSPEQVFRTPTGTYLRPAQLLDPTMPSAFVMNALRAKAWMHKGSREIKGAG